MTSIGDVAKLAGVSRSTVSLVCNNKGYVSEETRKKIEKAMKELNYIPSELGRNLKMQKSGIVGIIVPDIAHPFFSTFIKYAEKELYSRGYKALVCGTAGREGEIATDQIRTVDKSRIKRKIGELNNREIEELKEVFRQMFCE